MPRLSVHTKFFVCFPIFLFRRHIFFLWTACARAEGPRSSVHVRVSRARQRAPAAISHYSASSWLSTKLFEETSVKNLRKHLGFSFNFVQTLFFQRFSSYQFLLDCLCFIFILVRFFFKSCIDKLFIFNENCCAAVT